MAINHVRTVDAENLNLYLVFLISYSGLYKFGDEKKKKSYKFSSEYSDPGRK